MRGEVRLHLLFLRMSWKKGRIDTDKICKGIIVIAAAQ